MDAFINLFQKILVWCVAVRISILSAFGILETDYGELLSLPSSFEATRIVLYYLIMVICLAKWHFVGKCAFSHSSFLGYVHALFSRFCEPRMCYLVFKNQI